MNSLLYRVPSFQTIGVAFLEYFSKNLEVSGIFCFQANWSRLFTHKDVIDLTTLEASFTLAKIKMGTFEQGADKAPRLDDSHCYSFKNIGHISKLISYIFVRTFTVGGPM